MEARSTDRHNSGVTIVEEVKPTVTMMPPVSRPTPTATPATSRRGRPKSATKSRTSTSSWVGIRPVERQLMRPWLTKKIDDGQIPGLEWVDASKTKFRIPWKHGSRQGWKHDQDACLFMHWAQHTGRYRADEPPNPKRWKANFRCAINSLPDVQEVKGASQTRGQNAFRVYQFMAERKPRVPSGANKRKASEATSSPARPMSVSVSPTMTTGTSAAQCRPRSLPLPTATTSTPAVTGTNSSFKFPAINSVPMVSESSSTSYSPVSSPGSPPSSPDCRTPTPDHTETPNMPYKIFTEWQLHADNQGYRPCLPETTALPDIRSAGWATPPGTSHPTRNNAPSYRHTTPNTNHSVNNNTMSTATSQIFTIPTPPRFISHQNHQSFPTVTSQATSGFPATTAHLPEMTLDLAVTSQLDYDSGIGSPSSLGSGQHSDMECFEGDFSDSRSDISVELSSNEISEVFKYLNNSSEEQMAFCSEPYAPETQQAQAMPQWQPRPRGIVGSHGGSQNVLCELDDVACMLDIMYSITVKGPINDPAASTIDATVSARLNDNKSG